VLVGEKAQRGDEEDRRRLCLELTAAEPDECGPERDIRCRGRPETARGPNADLRGLSSPEGVVPIAPKVSPVSGATYTRKLLAGAEREALPLLAASLYLFAVIWLAPFELVQDSWLALVAGREVATGGPPERDALTVYTQGSTWVDQQWLAQLVFYAVSVAGGVKAVVLLHVAFLAAAMATAIAAARARGGSPRSVFVLAVALVLMAPWSWQMRTQSLAYVFFAGLLWLLAAESSRPSRRVYLALPLLVVWANLHGSVVLGVLLCGLFALAFALGELASSVRASGWWRRPALLLIASPLCLIASPYGVSLIGYYEQMLFSPTMSRFVNEWRETTFSSAWIFFGLAFASVWLLARHGTRTTSFEKAALLATIVIGLLAVRNVVWFGLAALVIVPRTLDEASPRVFERETIRRRFAMIAVAASVLIFAGVAATASLSSSWYVQEWPDKPLHAVERAIARDPSARVFASARYADWLLWKRPELAGRVAYDVRFELVSEPKLERLAAFHARTGAGWKSVADGYAVIVIDRRLDGDLERAFLAEVGTRVIYGDARISVLVRTSG
jgi:MFS family permease